MRELLARRGLRALGREVLPRSGSKLPVRGEDDRRAERAPSLAVELRHLAERGLGRLEPELQEGEFARVRGGRDARLEIGDPLLLLRELRGDGLGATLGLDHGGDDDLGGRGVLEGPEPGLRLREGRLAGVERRDLALVRGALAPAEAEGDVRGHLGPGDLVELTLDRCDEDEGVAEGAGLDHEDSGVKRIAWRSWLILCTSEVYRGHIRITYLSKTSTHLCGGTQYHNFALLSITHCAILANIS